MSSIDSVAAESSAFLDSLVSYFQEVKPYRTKLALSGAISEQYIFSDTINVNIVDVDDLKVFLGADLLPSTFSALGVRTRESFSWYQDLVSDGVRTTWPMPLVSNPKFSSSASLQNFTVGTNDYQGIAGLTHGVFDQKRWDGPGITDVRRNGVHQQDGIDYVLSHGVFSFDTLGILNGVPSWLETDVNNEIPTIEQIEGRMDTGPTGALAAYAAFSAQPGDLAYADVQRLGGTLTAITGTTYEEFGATCISILPAVLNVFSTKDPGTSLGTVQIEDTFTLHDSSNNIRIQFTYTWAVGQTAETAVVTDKYLITPSHLVVVSPTAIEQTWSLIKVNPLSIAAKPVFIPRPGTTRTAGTPALEVHTARTATPALTDWTLTFNGAGSYTLTAVPVGSSTPLAGYPLSISLLNGCSYADANVAFSLLPTIDGWFSGDTFSWQTDSGAHYKVFGSVSGWSNDAVVGEWYWNGQVGFKIPELKAYAEIYNSTIATSVNGGQSTWQTSVSNNQVLNSVIFESGVFYIAGDGQVVGASTNGGTWTSNIASVFQPPAGSLEMLVVEGEGGLIAYTSDGITWYQEQSGVSYDLHSLANIPNFLASQGSSTNDLNCLIVVGDHGTILTSINAIGWAQQTSGTTKNLNGIAWSNDNIVVIGDGGTILLSQDRLTWTAAISTTVENLNSIVYVQPTPQFTQGIFTVVGNNGTILRSTNGGVTWLNLNANVPATADFSSVAYGNGLYIAVGPTGTVAESADGITWTSYNGKAFESIAYGNGTFVAVGGSTNDTPQFVPLGTVSPMAVPSTYVVTFTTASDTENNIPGQATVYNNQKGYGKNLITGQEWSDEWVSFTLSTIAGLFDYSVGDVVNVYLAPSQYYPTDVESYAFEGYDLAPYDLSQYDSITTGYNAAITEEAAGARNMTTPLFYNSELYPLYHSHGAVIFPQAQVADAIVIDKAYFDKLKFKITGASSNFPALGAVDDWLPMFFKFSDVVNSSYTPTSTADFSDLATFIEAFSCATGERIFYIVSPRYEKTNRAAQSTLTFDSAFFAKYMIYNTKYSIVVQPDESYGQTIRVKINENLKVYARINLIFNDPVMVVISDSAPDSLEIIDEVFFGEGPITGYWRWELTTPPTTPPAVGTPGWVFVTPFSDPEDQAWTYPFSINIGDAPAAFTNFYDTEPGYDVFPYDSTGIVPMLVINEAPNDAGVPETAASKIVEGLQILMTVNDAYELIGYDINPYDTDYYDSFSDAFPPETAGETTLSFIFNFSALQPSGSIVPGLDTGLSIPALAPNPVTNPTNNQLAANYVLTMTNVVTPPQNVFMAPESDLSAVGATPVVYKTVVTFVNGQEQVALDPNSIIFSPPPGLTAPFRVWLA